jgi:AraC-like DNA-binding protein
MTVPPMPSAHLFVNLGGPVRLWDSDPSVPPAVVTDGWFVGIWSRRFLLEYPTQVRLVGVHFKPWGMSPFVDLPAAELRDRWVPVGAVWRRSVERIRNQLGDTASAGEALRVVEAELRARLVEAPPPGLDLVLRTGRRLAAAHGALRVGALTDAAGVSGNHLATQFKAHVGITPKRMARIYRSKKLAGDRTVAVNAGDVGGQVLAAGLMDEVAMDVVPVVFGSGKRFFGGIDGQYLLADPHVMIQGERVLHLRFKVSR